MLKCGLKWKEVHIEEVVMGSTPPRDIISTRA